MQLVIAEKPSVAMALSKVLGAKSRGDGYMEGGGWLVSWCIGHLVELAPADAYDPRYSKWNYADLPILPEPWQYQVLPDTKKQFETLKSLMHRADVTALICATDAGREGELIFRLTYHLCGCTKPVKRLWISSMEETAISGFRKEKFYTVELELEGFRAASERFASKTDAGRLRTSCVGKPATVQTVSQKEKTERPPRLYDLTTLQREANRLFDYTAQQTLDYLQSLYEKRLATYPRTDSRYLTEDMAAGLPGLCQSIAAALPFAADLPLPVNAAQVIDNSKVTDHHAILPTAETAKTDLSALPSGEKNILFLAAARLLCAVGEPHTYAETAVTLECGGAVFSAKGKTEIAAGWTALEQAFHATLKQKPKQAEPSPPLPALTEGQKLTAEGASVKEGATSPPAHFTEDTLLSAMEHASAEDFAKLEDVERKGLGTPATRAGVIEKLVRSGFVERKKKQLLPTEKGTELIKVMPDALKSARLTAEWEERLGAVERGELSPEDFMAGISAMLTELIKGYQGVTVASAALSASGRTVIGICPRCGKNVVEGKKSFFCEGWNATPACGFALWKNDRFFTGKRKELTRKVAAALLKNGRVAMTGLFSEKKGVLYDATVVMEDTGEKFVRFKLEFDPKTPKKKGN